MPAPDRIGFALLFNLMALVAGIGPFILLRTVWNPIPWVWLFALLLAVNAIIWRG